MPFPGSDLVLDTSGLDYFLNDELRYTTLIENLEPSDTQSTDLYVIRSCSKPKRSKNVSELGTRDVSVTDRNISGENVFFDQICIIWCFFAEGVPGPCSVYGDNKPWEIFLIFQF